MNLLRNPIWRLRCSPYGCTAALLGASSGCSRRFRQTFCVWAAARTNDADSDEARALRPLQAAACTYRIVFGPRAGQKVLTVQGTMPRAAEF
ncbi:MAG: hypothetical protein Q8K96_19115, partial [Rubrivivax sp.]|nr:hypothetical protein [Rubrivivax sp.]